MPTRKRPLPFDPILCRESIKIKRFFSRMQYFRAVAARNDKRVDNAFVPVQLAALRTGLRTDESVTWGKTARKGGRRDGIAPSGRRPLAARSEWRLSPRSGLRDISAGFRGRSARGKGRGGLRQAPVRTGALMSDVARPGRSPVDGTTGQKRDRPCRSPTAGSAPPTRRL